VQKCLAYVSDYVTAAVDLLIDVTIIQLPVADAKKFVNNSLLPPGQFRKIWHNICAYNLPLSLFITRQIFFSPKPAKTYETITSTALQAILNISQAGKNRK